MFPLCSFATQGEGYLMSSPEIPKPPDDLIRAAETGDAEAQSDLGRWYKENVPGTPYAEIWFQRAADQGLPRALHNMGVVAFDAGDKELAIEWFRKAVAAGWRNSIHPLGRLLEENGDIQGAFETYNQGVTTGCTDSMAAMGRLVIDNEIEELYGKARIWCEKAVANGHLGAHMQLAQIFHEGLGIKTDPKQAISLWLRAAWQGHPGGQLMIGMACDVGLVLKKDRVAAMRFLSASAAQGNDGASACLQSVGRTLTHKEKAAFESEPMPSMPSSLRPSAEAPPPHLLWAAEAGDVESQNELGVWYVKNLPHTPYAQIWLRRAADQGDANAYHNLGAGALNSGDLPLAAEWFKKAVNADLLDSYASLGSVLERTGDLVGAIEIFGQGANRLCPNCQSSLGRLAFNEKTQGSYKRAHHWDEKAAAQGNAASQTRLGMMYHEGLGVEPSPEKAVHWWQQGARQGNMVAQYMMGIAHHKGAGTSKDRLAAIRFLRASAAQGGTYAEKYLAQVEGELTPEERALFESETIATKH